MINKTDNVDNTDKFPFFKSVFGSFGTFMDNFRSYLFLGSIFSIIIMLFSYLNGQSLMCANITFKKYVICGGNIYTFILSTVGLWFIFCVYARIFCQTAILKKYKFSIKSLLPNKTDVKLFGVAMLYGLSIFIALASGFLLFIRVPNPNWIIELLFFTVVSLGFFVPAVASPLLSYASFVVEGEKLPSIKELWQTSRNKIIMIFMSFVSIILINFMLTTSVLRYFMQLSMVENIFVVVIAEFLYNILLMLVVSVYMCYCYMQKKFLFERN